MFAGKKSAQIREILISESAWEEMTCLFAPSLGLCPYYVGRIKMPLYGDSQKFTTSLTTTLLRPVSFAS
ncbi:hypothetical protein FTO72_14270 [Escherichia coli]|nr:hypothetical protein FTO72_14270 [Escherichia coli]